MLGLAFKLGVGRSSDAGDCDDRAPALLDIVSKNVSTVTGQTRTWASQLVPTIC